MARKARQVRVAMGPLPAPTPSAPRGRHAFARSRSAKPRASREARTWDVAKPRVTGNGGPPAARRILPPDGPVLDGRRALSLAAVSGALLALAFPDHRLGAGRLGRASCPSCSPHSGAVRARRSGPAWVAGFVFFLATLYWLVLTIGTYTNLAARERRSARAAVRVPGARVRDRDRRLRGRPRARDRARARRPAALGARRMDPDVHPRRLPWVSLGYSRVSRHLSRAVRRGHRDLRLVGAGGAGERRRLRRGATLARGRGAEHAGHARA